MPTPSPSPRRSARSSRLSRRTFLKGTAAAVAGPAGLAACQTVIPAQDPDVLKVGLIGCGGRGTGAAAQALSAENGTVVLTAMADVFPERVEASLASLKAAMGEERAGCVQVDPEYCFSGLDGYKQVIDADVDVVLLATPPYFRPQHLEAAVAAGKHIFCEKPVAVDGPGIRSVLASAAKAREQGLSWMGGFCWRRNIRERALYARVLDGALGQLRAVYATYNTSPLGKSPRQEGWSDLEWTLRNWQHFNWLSGDHIVEQAVHSVDKIAWAMGDVPALSCVAVGGRQARTGAESGDIFDHFGVTYDYADDVKAFLMTRQMANCANENNDYLWGEKGNAIVRGWTPEHVITGENAWEYEGEGNNMYQQEHDELFAAIRAGQPVNDGVWMTHSCLLALMGRMAAYTGKVITWEQALNSEEKVGPETLDWEAAYPVGPVPIPGKTVFL